MNVLLLIALMCLPLLPPIAAVSIARYGPWSNRWWRGETVSGFTVTITVSVALLGFIAGGLMGGNLGPPLGVLVFTPIGLALGVVWGIYRARRRAANRG